MAGRGGACERDRRLILLVRHPAVAAAGRCYGRLDLALADPASAGELAERILARSSSLYRGRDRFGVRVEKPETRCLVPEAHAPRPPPVDNGRGSSLTREVWSSPAQRCRDVAQLLGRYSEDERLQELDFGTWEGVPWDDVPRDSLDAWARDPLTFAPPDGENGRQLVERVGAFAAECLRDGDVVITHGGPLRVLLAVLAGRAVRLLDPPPGVGSLTAVDDVRPTPEA